MFTNFLTNKVVKPGNLDVFTVGVIVNKTTIPVSNVQRERERVEVDKIIYLIILIFIVEFRMVMFNAFFFFKHGSYLVRNGLSTNINQATTTNANDNNDDMLADDDLPENISVVSNDS